jgi:parallel beta-helix repeat protein
VSRYLPSLLVLVACGACGRFGFDPRAAPDAQDPQDADESTTRLIVTLAEDRMAGPPTMSSLADLAPGSVGLSLREALTIANHRPGSDVVAFDPAALPAGSTILINSALVVGGDGTRIDAKGAIAVGAATGYAGALIQVNGTGAVLDGLTLRGGTFGIQALAVGGITIRGLTIQDTLDHAIQLDSCSQVVVEDNRIERAGGDSLHLYSTTEALVQRNFVVLGAKTGTIAGFALEDVNRSRFLDNIIDPGEAHLIRLTNSSDNEIVGNILDRGESGIVLRGASNGNFVFRNVVTAPIYDSVFIEAPGANNKIINNTFYEASDVVDGGTGTMAVNNLVSDNSADFVDPKPPAYNFHLVAGHAAIDTGADLGLDMLPAAPERFLGSKPDTGAVESY